MKPPGSARNQAEGNRPPKTEARLGRYRLLGRIGEGGMAEVYRAVMTGPEGFERELVLKRILPKLSESGDFKTMFVREAKISALLLHPNIVQIYEFGQADGNYFIAMESVQGVTLREALTTLRKGERAVPHLIAADITRQICTGLDYAHTLRDPEGVPLEIVHQDISPTNIMLAFNGTVKILDFGIARAASFAEEEAKKGLIKGKVSYLSPEQIFVRPFDSRADVFALGVVFHEMMTGRRLFQSRNDLTKMRELLNAPILPPSAIDASIPRELDRITMRALELDPKNRYQSTADMAADLERTLIAARYSSRELSKMLHDLYLSTDEPVVVVEATQEREPTAAITATETLPPAERTSASHPSHDGNRLTGALRAEKSRLQWARWRGRIKLAMTAFVVAVMVGAAVLAGRRYLPALLASPPAAAPAPFIKNQEAPKPAPAPAPPAKAVVKKKQTGRRGKSSATSAPTPADEPATKVPATAPGDAPLPPSSEAQ
jgi:eukaryotic-like serine/threonine-protein kinase